MSNKLILNEIYDNEIDRKLTTQQQIEEIDNCKGYCWDYDTMEHSDWGLCYYIYQCKHFDYKNGCICKLSKTKQKCFGLIEYGYAEPTWFGKLLGMPPKKYIKKCKYIELIKGANVGGFRVPYLNEHDKSVYTYRNELINSL